MRGEERDGRKEERQEKKKTDRDRKNGREKREIKAKKKLNWRRMLENITEDYERILMYIRVKKSTKEKGKKEMNLDNEI